MEQENSEVSREGCFIQRLLALCSKPRSSSRLPHKACAVRLPVASLSSSLLSPPRSSLASLLALSTPTRRPPQGLCTCCSRYLEGSGPRF